MIDRIEAALLNDAPRILRIIGPIVLALGLVFLGLTLLGGGLTWALVERPLLYIVQGALALWLAQTLARRSATALPVVSLICLVETALMRHWPAAWQGLEPAGLVAAMGALAILVVIAVMITVIFVINSMAARGVLE